MQDLLHAMEFAPNKEERNRIATKMQRSRITRRDNKDLYQRYELVAEFSRWCEPGRIKTHGAAYQTAEIKGNVS